MNIYQRVVLVLGAVILILAIYDIPPLYKDQFGQFYHADSEFLTKEGVYGQVNRLKDTAPLQDIRTISVRAIGVLGVTMLLCFALKGLKATGKKDS